MVTLRSLLVALALTAGLIGPAVSTAPVAADEPATGIGIRLVDVPTAAADDPRARGYIIDHLKPGTTIERRVEVTNGTGSRARIAMYAGAASVTKDGFTGAAGRTRNDLATWTSLDPPSLSLAAGERAFVSVTVRVPASAVRGERYGVVWAETTTKPKTTAGVSNVTQVSRVGIRLYLSIGPGGAPISDFAIESLTAVRGEDGVPSVQATVRNTGERALDLSGSLQLSQGPAGLSAGPFSSHVGTTLGIGDTEPVFVPLDQRLPNGPWLVKMTVKSGVTQRSAQATLTFPEGPGVGPAVAAESGPWARWARLVIAMGAGLLVLLGLVAWVLLRRRRDQARHA